MEVLFVCNGNITRSQIAKELFNHLSTNHAECAGTRVHQQEGQTLKEVVEEAAARGVSVVVLRMMAEEQMDLSGNTRKQVTAAMVDAADKVIVMADKDTLPDYLLANAARFLGPATPRASSMGKVIRSSRVSPSLGPVHEPAV